MKYFWPMKKSSSGGSMTTAIVALTYAMLVTFRRRAPLGSPNATANCVKFSIPRTRASFS